ncbi:MAG: V-type ATP synthase subunit I, partial [Candidatus Competibacteraceae bacterium]|nr:V-type ATP synthase subunit I [Candidatus Competibacteraceae bacterium]
MAIVALSKLTLCGPLADKPATLAALQSLGCLHLTPLRPPPAEPESAPAPQPRRTEQALRYLLDCPDRRRQVRDWQDFHREAVVELALTNQRHSRELTDRRDFLVKRIREMEPWGDFLLPPLEQLAGQRLWFYRVPHYQLGLIDPQLVWQEVDRDHRHAYVVVVAPQEPAPQGVPVPRVHLGALSLSQLRERLEKVEIRLEELAAERQALTRWLVLLLQCLAAARDRAALEWAGEQTLERDGVFALQGWAPVARLMEVESLVRQRGLALLVEEPTPSDQPPTLLDNPEPLAGGQEVVAFYQMPGYRAWDPSPVIFLSFALFFAMILADAGYALLLGLVLLALGRRLAASIAGRRVKRMGWTIVALSLAYGVLSGGYFGFAAPPGSLLARLDILDLDDFDAMMQLSVAVGVLHLLAANGLLAWRERHSPHALAPLGWIGVLTGGYGWWQGAAFGPWLVGSGVGLVL